MQPRLVTPVIATSITGAAQPRSGCCPLRLQFREQIHGVQHLSVRVIKLQHAYVDHPHREHLRDPVAPGHAPAPVDPDVFLNVIDVDAIRASGRWTDAELLRLVAADPKCVAWGELGLDNHYPEPSPTAQREVLAAQLAHIEGWTKEGLSKPIVIHCREAFDDLLPRLAASSLPRDRYVFHCFTGTVDEARRVLDFGAWISFTGVASYRNAPEVQAAVRLVPADRIMVETDAPFLSPEPHRKVRPCQPWMASVTAKAIAALRGEQWEAFHSQINANTQRFFGIV
jgi:TatD DNase family protein